MNENECDCSSRAVHSGLFHEQITMVNYHENLPQIHCAINLILEFSLRPHTHISAPPNFLTLCVFHVDSTQAHLWLLTGSQFCLMCQDVWVVLVFPLHPFDL